VRETMRRAAKTSARVIINEWYSRGPMIGDRGTGDWGLNED
jgi:hypothetical protein